MSKSDLTTQQNTVINFIYEQSTLLIAQAGAGKTVVAQTTAQELIDDEILTRVIIFAPLKVCQLTWASEWRNWEHLREPTMALGDANQRRDVVNEGPELVVMNIDNLAWFFREFGHDHGFDGLVIDECSKLKDPGGAAFKKLRHHLKDFEWRLPMSATPVHEAAVDIYTQIFIVDGGKVLGRNQEVFKRKYFTPTDYQQRHWEFMPTMEAKLTDAISEHVIVMDTEQYEADLPHLEDVIVPVLLSPKEWETYNDMANTMLAEIEDTEIEAPNLAVMQGKLQMICCGAMYSYEADGIKRNGDIRMKKNTHWVHKHKFDQLSELVGRWQDPVIIVYQFEFELEMLKSMYTRAMVLGDDPVTVEALWNAGKCDILLMHPKSGGHGINLQMGGCRMIWMSPVWSADLWDQCIRRIWRRGQASDSVWRYILMVENSVERLILDRHLDKMGESASFIDHLRERQHGA